MNKTELTRVFNRLEATTNASNITLSQCINSTENSNDALNLLVLTSAISNIRSWNTQLNEVTTDYVFDMFYNELGKIEDCSYDYESIITVQNAIKSIMYQDLVKSFDYNLLENSIIDSLRSEGLILDGVVVSQDFLSSIIAGQDQLVSEVIDLITQAIEESLKVNVKNLKYMNSCNFTLLNDSIIDMIFSKYDIKNISIYMNTLSHKIDIFKNWKDEDKKTVKQVVYKNNEWIFI